MSDQASERFIAHRCALGSCECTLKGSTCPADVTACNGCPHHARPSHLVAARLGAGLQASGRPAGHGGGCRCHECRAVEGP